MANAASLRKKDKSTVALDMAKLHVPANSTETSGPLYSAEDQKIWDEKFAALEKKFDKASSWAEYWKAKETLIAEKVAEDVRRAQTRPEEYLNALLHIIVNKGDRALTLADAFSRAGPHLESLDNINTPDNRRLLHSLLKSLTEIPAEWNEINFRKFLKGLGEEGQAKNNRSGRAFFKGNQDWNDTQITFICQILVGETELFAQILRLHAQSEDLKIEEEHNEVPVPANADFVIVSTERQFENEDKCSKPFDLKFIEKLLSILEVQGLGQVPCSIRRSTISVLPLHNGDIITAKQKSEIPLPAHIRLNLERRLNDKTAWKKGLAEIIVTEMHSDSTFSFNWYDPQSCSASVDTKKRKLNQKVLVGALFLKKWEEQKLSAALDKYDYEIKGES